MLENGRYNFKCWNQKNYKVPSMRPQKRLYELLFKNSRHTEHNHLQGDPSYLLKLRTRSTHCLTCAVGAVFLHHYMADCFRVLCGYSDDRQYDPARVIQKV